MSSLLAMVVTIAWLPVFGRLAKRWSIVDMPGTRKVHTVPIPRVGGIAMMIGVLVAALVAVPLGRLEISFLIAAVVLTLFGALDDRFDLDYRLKLAGQVIAAVIVIAGGSLQVHALTFDEHWMLPQWIGVPLTLLFLVGITNAINLADGLDGLAGGTTFLCLCALALLAHGGGQIVCAALALAFAGAVLGFLRFNTFPASVFMGDAGSQVLGFAVGVLSIAATQNVSSAVSAATPVLLLALPILDTLSVMVQRIGEGRSPFSPDKNHIHHRLLELGFDHHEAVVVIYAVQADLFLLAYWLRYESDLVILGVVSLFFLVAIGLLQLAQRHGWRFRSADARPQHTPLTRMLTALRHPDRLPRWSYLLVACSVGAYALSVMADTASLSSDVRLLLVAMLAVTVVLLVLLRVQPLKLVERAALYITAAVLVFLDGVVLPEERALYWLNGAAILLAATGTVLRLRLANDRRFELTPLDLIVLFVALVIPSLADSLGLPNGGVINIAKLVVLFYAIEVLIDRAEVRVVWLRLAETAVLAALVLRPLIAP